MDSCATCGSTSVGMVRFENVRADKNLFAAGSGLKKLVARFAGSGTRWADSRSLLPWGTKPGQKHCNVSLRSFATCTAACSMLKFRKARKAVVVQGVLYHL